MFKNISLTDTIIKATVPDAKVLADPGTRTRIGQLEAWVSILINTILTAIKVALGIAVNSLALIGDGVHSFSDVVTSGVVLFGFRIAGKPADKEHPFGHGRAEYIATLVIAIMLGVVGFEFIRSAIARLLEPVPITANWIVLLVVFLTLLMKLWLGQFSMALGLHIESSTLKADAWHHRSDAISSVLVLLALAGSSLGYPALDGVGGVLMGGFLIWTGFAIARSVIDPLLGGPPSSELIKRIQNLCRKQENVVGIHDITVHDYGHHRYLTLHVEVSDQLAAQESHEIAEQIQDLLRQELGAYAIVHIDPIDQDGEVVLRVKALLDDLISSSQILIGYHDLRVVNQPERRAILLDAMVSSETSISKQQTAQRWLHRELLKAFPDTRIAIQIAPPHVYE